MIMNYRQIKTIKHSQTKTSKVIEVSANEKYFMKVYRDIPLNELFVYEKLQQPHLHGFSTLRNSFQQNNCTCLVFDLLSDDVETLRKRCLGTLSLKTVLMLGLQMVDRIQFLHHNGFIHGDIKPSNFLLGSGRIKHKLFLVDFDLSTPYMRDGVHVPQSKVQVFSGSLRFCSRRANDRSSISRRDDIQSCYYTMIYLLKGDLPWMHLLSTTLPEAYSEVGTIKSKQLDNLLEQSPGFFKDLFAALRKVKYNEQPNYGEIKHALQVQMKRNGYEMDYKYDWE